MFLPIRLKVEKLPESRINKKEPSMLLFSKSLSRTVETWLKLKSRAGTCIIFCIPNNFY